MTAKRRAVDDGDGESSPPGSPVVSNKRARTTNGNAEERQRANRKGKGKARVVESDDDMSEEDEEDGQMEIPTNEDSEEKDQQFEAENYERVMNSIKARDKSHGLIAEVGVVEKVELYQFMCHQRLTFNFGPQINFIIGHNGSGKSAVLSAITIALGGKTASTGRGNGLKAFIREGQSHAEVTIYLRNRGHEAYKHQEFGDVIIINRKFSREGSSSWKIKSKDNRVISTKREEVSKICDHMNIQIDNPLTVLTQDASRVFLASSNPTERYTFFMKGTQLQQLSEEYNITMDNVESTSRVLAQKKEAISDLRLAAQQATAKYNDATAAQKQKHKTDELKKELAWAHVKSKEDELEAQLVNVASSRNKLPKVQAEIDSAEENLLIITNEFTETERKYGELGSVVELEKRRAEIQQQIKVYKNEVMTLQGDLKTMNNQMSGVRNSITDFEKKIQDETARMAKNTQEKRDQVQRQLADARAELMMHEDKIKDIHRRREDHISRKEQAETEGKKIDKERSELLAQIEYQMNTMRNYDQAEKDSLLPYGRNIKGVLEKINNMRWHGIKPLGPLGQYVKAKDPATWGDILRSQLGQFLTAFAITDARDRNQLKNILMQSKNPHVQIIISSTELFDYSEGEPPYDYLTVLRALEFSDPLVLRILINSAGIENRVLARTRLEAQQMLERLPRGGQAFSLDLFTVRVFTDGIFSIPLEIRRSNDSSNLMLTGSNSAEGKIRAQQEIERLQREVALLDPQLAAFKNEYMENNKMLVVLQDEESKLTRLARAAHTRVQTLQQDLNEEVPMNVNVLYDAKKEAEAEVDSISKQFEAAMMKKKEVDEKMNLLIPQRTEVNELIRDFDNRKLGVKRQIEAIAERRIRTQADKSHWEKKLKEAEEKVAKEQANADVLQAEFVAWTARAEEFCEKVPTLRPVEEVQKLYESMSNALKAREKKQGASLEELEVLLFKAQDQFETAKSDYKAMNSLIKKLRHSLIVRYARWEDFRRHIALRTKIVFQYHLSQRGYFGKLLFDHRGEQLVLKVQTDDQASQQGHREKDPRSLSGGEKSFSTICLLLALWESIGCPIRCLDEFDVFMDAVNRRISMKMMIDTANTSNNKQYILITPLEMANIAFGNTVRVNKMPDPQRNQATLDF